MDADDWRREAEARSAVLRQVMKSSLIQQAAMQLDPMAYLGQAGAQMEALLLPTIVNIHGVDIRRARLELRRALDAILPEAIAHFRDRATPPTGAKRLPL